MALQAKSIGSIGPVKYDLETDVALGDDAAAARALYPARGAGGGLCGAVTPRHGLSLHLRQSLCARPRAWAGPCVLVRSCTVVGDLAGPRELRTLDRAGLPRCGAAVRVRESVSARARAIEPSLHDSRSQTVADDDATVDALRHRPRPDAGHRGGVAAIHQRRVGGSSPGWECCGENGASRERSTLLVLESGGL